MKTRKLLENDRRRTSNDRLSLYQIGSICVMLYVAIALWYLTHRDVDHKDSKHISDSLVTTNQQQQKRVIKQNTGVKNNNKRIFINFTKNPTIIFWTQDTGLELFSIEKCGKYLCDMYYTDSKIMLLPNREGAYLFYGTLLKWNDLPLPRNPAKVIWALAHEESPKNVLEFMHEEGLNIFNYSSTFSRHSDVPYPLHYMMSLNNLTSRKYFVKTAVKNLALNKIAPILYLQSICGTLTKRDEYVKELMKYQHIDSYGSCLKNKHSPNFSRRKNYDYLNNLWEENLLKFIARYKFVIAIENGVCDDYVSEKFWRAIHLGVVPIYFGSPTIRDWMPNEKSAILLEDFSTPKLLSRHIDKLMQDDELYEEYLEHKTKGMISNTKLINEIRERPYQTDSQLNDREFKCFLCKKLHDKNKGVHIVTKKHFNCPKPRSILTKKETLKDLWDVYKTEARNLYEKIMRS